VTLEKPCWCVLIHYSYCRLIVESRECGKLMIVNLARRFVRILEPCCAPGYPLLAKYAALSPPPPL
jgi:hypothetical protein